MNSKKTLIAADKDTENRIGKNLLRKLVLEEMDRIKLEAKKRKDKKKTKPKK
jgi:hypothetical protein